MTSHLWIPSDELLGRDPIALQKILAPFEPEDLEAQGILLGDIDDDDANEAAACLVLASIDDDDLAGSETGETDDDEDLDDPDDGEAVSGDV